MERPGRTTHIPLDILAVLVWTGGTAGVLLLPVVRSSPLRVVVGLGFLLFVPGYLFLAVVFPRADQLSLFERGVFAAATSFALNTLLPILLTRRAAGITFGGLVGMYLLVTLVLTGVALVRRRHVPADRRADPGTRLLEAVREVDWRLPSVGGGSAPVRIVLAVTVVASAGALVFTLSTPLPSEQYTELYVLGANGTVDDLPETAAADDTVEFVVGVRNNEHRSTRYGVQVQAVGEGGTVHTLERVAPTVDHGEDWRHGLEVGVPPRVDRVTYRVLLFRGPAPPDPVGPTDAYRHARIPVRVTAPGADGAVAGRESRGAVDRVNRAGDGQLSPDWSA
jgi:uncharacterized membrane protein